MNDLQSFALPPQTSLPLTCTDLEARVGLPQAQIPAALRVLAPAAEELREVRREGRNRAMERRGEDGLQNGVSSYARIKRSRQFAAAFRASDGFVECHCRRFRTSLSDP